MNSSNQGASNQNTTNSNTGVPLFDSKYYRKFIDNINEKLPKVDATTSDEFTKIIITNFQWCCIFLVKKSDAENMNLDFENAMSYLLFYDVRYVDSSQNEILEISNNSFPQNIITKIKAVRCIGAVRQTEFDAMKASNSDLKQHVLFSLSDNAGIFSDDNKLKTTKEPTTLGFDKLTPLEKELYNEYKYFMEM